VHPSQEIRLRELPQVAADGVGGDVERGAQIRGDDLSVAMEPLEDQLPAFFREHVRIQAETRRNVQKQTKECTNEMDAGSPGMRRASALGSARERAHG